MASVMTSSINHLYGYQFSTDLPPKQIVGLQYALQGHTDFVVFVHWLQLKLNSNTSLSAF